MGTSNLPFQAPVDLAHCSVLQRLLQPIAALIPCFGDQAVFSSQWKQMIPFKKILPRLLLLLMAVMIALFIYKIWHSQQKVNELEKEIEKMKGADIPARGNSGNQLTLIQ